MVHDESRMWRDDYGGGWEFRRYALKYSYMVNGLQIQPCWSYVRDTCV